MWLFMMMFGPTAGFWNLASTMAGTHTPAPPQPEP